MLLDVAADTSPPHLGREAEVSSMYGQAEYLVLESELLFLELVKKDVVGVGSPLFRVNL
jgi:hypothetical protein